MKETTKIYYVYFVVALSLITSLTGNVISTVLTAYVPEKWGLRPLWRLCTIKRLITVEGESSGPTPLLIIWSIIGLKWAAYMTIPFIIILFKWTNCMMAFFYFSPSLMSCRANFIVQYFNLFPMYPWCWLHSQIVDLCMISNGRSSKLLQCIADD